MMFRKVLKIMAGLAPVAAFIWIDQMSSLTKEIVSAFLIAAASILSVAFWKSIRRDSISDRMISLKQELTDSFAAGMMLLLLLMFTCYIYPLGGYLARPLIVEHSNDNAEAIFVLASGATETGDPTLSGLQRISHGAKLLKAGRAPHLYISTGYSKRTGHLEHGWVASYTELLELNPASFTILVSPEITTTFTEAAHARKVLAAKGINCILLVTSGAHIYRSWLTFMKAGFEVLPAPAHNRASVVYSSESYLTALRASLHEWLGLVYYRLQKRI